MPRVLAGAPLPLRIVLGVSVVARPAFLMMTDVLPAASAPCEVNKLRANERAMAFLRRFMGIFLFLHSGDELCFSLRQGPRLRNKESLAPNWANLAGTPRIVAWGVADIHKVF